MNASPKDFPVSWEEIMRHSKLLAWRLQEKAEWQGIAAVTRGGLVPACLVAQEMSVRVIETICVQSYDHQAQGDLKLLKSIDALGDGAGWLVIDDLVDTGNTYRALRKLLPKAHFAAVYAKPQGISSADTYIVEVSQDTWIYFPWEKETQERYPLVPNHP